ncbi:MAG TPA: OsmC family protein, partial [Candidatus Nanopelagicales bacterium]
DRDRAELRARRAELEQAYRDDPQAALTQVSARATFADPGITTTVDGWAGPVRAGLHPALGGHGSDACSADMLLQALLGCAGVTLRSVAEAMRLELRQVELTATAVFDARGTLGLDREAPVGLRQLEVVASVATDAPEASLVRLAELTDRYCVVGQTLDPRPTTRVVRIPLG